MANLRTNINTKKLFRKMLTNEVMPDNNTFAVVDESTGDLIVSDEIQTELKNITADRTEIYNDKALFDQNKYFIKTIEDLRDDMEHLHTYIKTSFGTASDSARRSVSNSLNSTATNTAATSKALKDVNDRIDTVLQGADVSYDTLKEISDQVESNISGLATKLNKSGGTLSGALNVTADISTTTSFSIGNKVVIDSTAKIDASSIKNVPSSWTALRGVSDSVASTSTTTAASSKAVKTAYDKANHSHPYSTASDLTAVRFDKGSLYFTVKGTEYEVKLIKLI